MVDSSAGKILSQARLAKRLTIDEVAHATKLRPDKIVALENDDYTRFGGLAYGKGFLQIYARFLGVDITEQLRSIDTAGGSVSIADYQYLNSPHPPASTPRRAAGRRSERYERRERRAPSIVPLLVVLALGFLGVYSFYRLYAPRIGLMGPEAGAPAVVPMAVSPTPAPAAIMAPAPTAVAVPPLAPASKTPPEEPNSISSDRQVSPPRLAPPNRAPEAPTSDAAFLVNVDPSSTNRRVAPAEESAGVLNELIVEPIKKTWVKIHKDSPDSAPIFEDYLYPGARPLKLRGAKFFVEVRDQSAVQIRKNGHPIAYQAPGIMIP